MAAIADTLRRALHLAGCKDEAAFKRLPREEQNDFLAQARGELTNPGANDGLRMLDPRTIRRSPFNREHLDEAKLKDLTEDVKLRGVLQAGCVRPVKPAVVVRGQPIMWELIYGEGRWIAASRAGKLFPATVRDVDDVEAIEMQAVENLHREDLNPLDEAVKYQQLIERYEATMTSTAAIEKLCAKVQASKSTVYERMRLLKLPEAAQEALLRGKLPSSHAGLIAKLDDVKSQEYATKRILKPERYESESGESVMSFRMAKQLIEQIERRLSNIREYNKLNAEFVKMGRLVLSPQENEKLFQHEHSISPASDSGFVGADEACANDSNFRAWRKVLGKHAPAPRLAQAPDGTPIVVYSETEARAALKKVIPKSSSASSRPESELKQEREHKQRKKIFADLLGKVSNAAEQMEGPELLRFIFERVAGHSRDAAQAVIKRRGFNVPRDNQRRGFGDAMKGATGKQLRGVIAELLFAECYSPSTWASGWGETFPDACKVFRLDPPKWKVQASGSDT